MTSPVPTERTRFAEHLDSGYCDMVATRRSGCLYSPQDLPSTDPKP